MTTATQIAKLRMSRKLIFAAGLLCCFECHLDPEAEEARSELTHENGGNARLIQYLEGRFSLSPLETLAHSVLHHATDQTAKNIFASYDAFLKLMNDPGKRSVLEDLRPEDMRADPVFQEVREIGHTFQKRLTGLFFRDDPEIYSLTEFYGVF